MYNSVASTRYLYSWNLTDEGVHLLLSKLKSERSIKGLSLAFSNLYPNKVNNLIKVLKLNPQIKCLSFDCTSANSTNEAIQRMINSDALNNITELYFEDIKLSKDSLNAIAKLVNLTRFSATNSSLDHEDAELLATSLKKLVYLDLLRNKIGLKGFEFIADNLSNLINLQLSGCELDFKDPETDSKAAEAVAKLEKLQYLDFSGNESGVKVIEAITKLPGLTVLSLNGTNVTDNSALDLANSKITDLDLNFTGITDKTIEAFVRSSKKFTRLQVYNTNISLVGAVDLVKMTDDLTVDSKYQKIVELFRAELNKQAVQEEVGEPPLTLAPNDPSGKITKSATDQSIKPGETTTQQQIDFNNHLSNNTLTMDGMKLSKEDFDDLQDFLNKNPQINSVSLVGADLSKGITNIVSTNIFQQLTRLDLKNTKITPTTVIALAQTTNADLILDPKYQEIVEKFCPYYKNGETPPPEVITEVLISLIGAGHIDLYSYIVNRPKEFPLSENPEAAANLSLLLAHNAASSNTGPSVSAEETNASSQVEETNASSQVEAELSGVRLDEGDI